MSLLHGSVVTYMCNVMLCFCIDSVLTRSKERWDEKTWGDCTGRREETRTSWAVPRGRCRHVWRVPQRKWQKFRRCHPNVRLICYLYLYSVTLRDCSLHKWSNDLRLVTKNLLSVCPIIKQLIFWNKIIRSRDVTWKWEDNSCSFALNHLSWGSLFGLPSPG